MKYDKLFIRIFFLINQDDDMIEFETNGTPNFCNYHELYEEQNCKTEIVIFFRYHFDDT